MRCSHGGKFDRSRPVCDQQGHCDPDGVCRWWRAHVDRDRGRGKPAHLDRAPSGLGTGRLASARAHRGAQLSDRLTSAHDRRRILQVRSLLVHADRDAGPAGTRRSVKGNPERGTAGRPAGYQMCSRCSCPRTGRRTRAPGSARARCHAGTRGGGGKGTAGLLPTSGRQPCHRGRVARIHPRTPSPHPTSYASDCQSPG